MDQQTADVLIVGAGLSGLTAADFLDRQRPDLHVRIVEARARVGGRILTVNAMAAGYGFDLGPTWVWPGHPHVLELVETLGIPLFPQHERGHALFDRGADILPQRFAPPDSTTESWRLAGGVGALIGRLQARLPVHEIHLERIVHAIAEHAHGLLVSAQTPDGTQTYLARQVIITLPPRLVADTIRFVPALPAAVTLALRETQTWMGQAMKALLVYDRPFWRERGLSGLGVSDVGPVAQFHDASPPDASLGALFGWMGNHSHGRSLSPAERRQAIIAQAIRIYGRDAAAVRHYADHNWAEDRFTAFPSSELTAEQEHPRYGHPLLQPPQMQGRLHWAGTETAPVNGGYLDGAVASGQRAAHRVLQSL
jgi:monoamine oxidase